MKKQKYVTKNFLGVVFLKEGIWNTDGRHYSSVLGFISLLEDKDIAGFVVSNRESNWCARVTNNSGTESMNILGCQIRSISNIEKIPKDLAPSVLSMVKL